MQRADRGLQSRSARKQLHSATLSLSRGFLPRRRPTVPSAAIGSMHRSRRPSVRPSVRPPRRARSDVSSGIRVAQLRGEWERGGLAMTSGWRLKEGGGERDRVRRGRWRRRQRRVGESQQLLPPLGIIALTQSCYFSEQLRFGSTGVKDGARGRRCRRRLRGTRSSPLPSPSGSG